MGSYIGGEIVKGEQVTTGRIARELHVSEATVRSYAEAGLIPCSRTLGGHRRFNLEAVVDAWEHHITLHTHSPEVAEETNEMKPIEVSAAWKNDWAITAFHADEDDDPDQQVADLLHPEPFPGVRGKTRFVISRRLVGV